MIELVPISFRDACDFVQKHHRHNKPPRGHKFSVAVQNKVTNEIVGVAMAGRPIARRFDNGLTIEINRVCTLPQDIAYNANSCLYRALWRASKALGYKRVITYTQKNESGSSLKAAGFRKVKELPARDSWAKSTKTHPFLKMRDQAGTGGIDRILWEIISE